MSKADLIAELVATIRQLMATSTAQARPLRIVLAIQGITDAHARTMLWSPITPHSDIAFADILESEFAIPATVQNDCNMMATALRWRDPVRYRNDFIAILLSHGIGMGLVLKGELFTGTQSSGGEFGHMTHYPDGALCRCGRRGCLEAYAGNYAIWRNATGKSENSRPEDGIDELDMKTLAARARAGEGPEREAYRKAGTAIGFGLGSLFALIDPAPVAFVGDGAAAFDILEPHIRVAIAQTAGGRHSDAISFDTVADELPLIRQGCAMQALTFVDEKIFAPGADGMRPESPEAGALKSPDAYLLAVQLPDRLAALGHIDIVRRRQPASRRARAVRPDHPDFGARFVAKAEMPEALSARRHGRRPP